MVMIMKVEDPGKRKASQAPVGLSEERSSPLDQHRESLRPQSWDVSLSSLKNDADLLSDFL